MISWEAVIQHNEADISTWEPHEYDLNLTYADDIVAFSPYLRSLRGAIRDDTKQKVADAQKTNEKSPGTVRFRAYLMNRLVRRASLTI